MLKKIIANAGMKKVIVFFFVFAVTVSAMSGLRHIDATGLSEEGGALFAYKSRSRLEQLPDTDLKLEDPPSSSEEEQECVEDRTAQPGGFVYCDKIPLSYELQEYTYEQCVTHNLEYELVLAMIWRESRFIIDAFSTNSDGTHDSGIMQINDINKEWLSDDHGIDDLMNPYQNIKAGTTMLGKLVKKHGEHEALMAYQYGEAGMVRKISQGVTTNDKIEALYKRRDYYRNLIDETKREPVKIDEPGETVVSEKSAKPEKSVETDKQPAEPEETGSKTEEKQDAVI